MGEVQFPPQDRSEQQIASYNFPAEPGQFDDKSDSKESIRVQDMSLSSTSEDAEKTAKGDTQVEGDRERDVHAVCSPNPKEGDIRNNPERINAEGNTEMLAFEDTAEEAVQRARDEENRKKVEETAKQKAAEEAAQRAKDEEDRKKVEEAAQRARDEENRKKAEEAAKQKAAEEAAKQKAAEEAAQRAKEEEDRKKAEEAAQRVRDKENRKKGCGRSCKTESC